MEENVKIVENESEERPVRRDTKQQNFLYLIISIALFFILYFGGKGIIDAINRPYFMIQKSENINEELLELQYEYADISKEYGVKYECSRLEKDKNGYKVSVLFSGIVDVDDFVENAILFEYGNAVEDVENEFYPYESEPTVSEDVIAVKYVDNDNPYNEILIFEYDDEIYAEYQGYGGMIPTDVKILFNGCEKVY